VAHRPGLTSAAARACLQSQTTRLLRAVHRARLLAGAGEPFDARTADAILASLAGYLEAVDEHLRAERGPDIAKAIRNIAEAMPDPKAVACEGLQKGRL
jgi:hypothetical protein